MYEEHDRIYWEMKKQYFLDNEETRASFNKHCRDLQIVEMTKKKLKLAGWKI